MPTRYITTLLRFRWTVFVLWGLLLLASATIYVKRFNIDNSVGIWFLDNDPALARYQDFNRAFGGAEWIFAVLQTRSLHDRGFLTRLHWVSAEIEALPEVERVFSIASAATFSHRNSGDGAVAPYALPYTNLVWPAAEPPAGLRDLLVHPGDDRHTAVLIRTSDPPLAENTEWARTVELIDGIFSKMTIEKYWLAGTPVINAELNRAARRDMLVFYCVLSLLLVAFGRVFLGQSRDLSVLLAVVLGSVLPPLGLVCAMGLSFNMVTLMLPTILVSMSASAAVHMINEFHLLRRTMPSGPALAEAVSALIRPAFWTTATTVAAFLTLVQSDVNPVRQVGYLAAFGISLGFLNTFVIAPLILDLFWKTRRAGPDTGGRAWIARGTARLAAAARPSRRIIAIAVLLFSGCLAGLPNLEADTDYVNFFRSGRQINADYRAISDAGFAQYSLELDVMLPPGGQVRDAVFNDAIHRLAADIETLPKVHKTITATQVPARTQAMPVAVRANAATDGTMQNPLGLTTPDGRRTRIVILGDHMSSQDLRTFRKAISTLADHRLPPGVRAEILGTNVLWSNMDISVVDTQRNSVAIIFCVLLLLMPVLARSIRIGLVGLFVSVLPVLSILGLMGWAGLTVNVATCLIGGVALGIAIDDTIFLLLRTRRELDDGSNVQQAVPKSLRVSGRAMVTTSAVMTICFLSMGLSDFLPTAQFGLLFALTMVAALTADLVLLPSLLLYLRWR